MPKPNKQHIIDALIKEVEQGKSFDTCLKLSETKWNLTRSTFIRRWKTANQQHRDAQQAIKKELAVLDTQSAINARKKAIMTADERKELLTRIAQGEIRIKIPYVIGGKIMEYPAEPSANDRRNAIAELNKMGGDYAPTKVANTDAEGNNVVPFTDSQVDKIIKAIETETS